MLIAAEDIPYCCAFTVEGVNATNPVTYEDTGMRALFAATKAYKAGDVVDGYTPLDIAVGMYRCVTRAFRDGDQAKLARI